MGRAKHRHGWSLRHWATFSEKCGRAGGVGWRSIGGRVGLAADRISESGPGCAVRVLVSGWDAAAKSGSGDDLRGERLRR